MAYLFQPLAMRDVTFRNRIGMSPMCQYSSKDGFAHEWHLVHLASRAVGGVGLVFTEAAAIEPEGRITPADLGIWSDNHVEMLSRITALVKGAGAVPGIQLAHAGRKASCAQPWEGGRAIGESQGGWRPIFAPSAIPFNSESPIPEALDVEGIERVRQAFLRASRRALEAGFQVIEIHAAHGYLLHEFLSPLSNQRRDQYGGSFDNRTRLLVEVVKTVREALPEGCSLWVRISATDWVEGGWDIDQSVLLSQKLKALEVDVVDCSSGGAVPGVRIPAGPGYQTPFCDRIRREAKVATAAVGMITAPEQAEHILRTQQADMVLLGRELLRDPYWAHKAAKALGADNHISPVQYQRAW